MLLVHQAGSVKVGEVVRYTLTYTPSVDRILPSPQRLHVKIKNTSAIPLRAAYLHGPYTLHVAAYPESFSPYKKVEKPAVEGIPQFEPNLKAGGSWYADLLIPDDKRESGDKDAVDSEHDGSPKRITWIVELASQVLFSSSAVVNFEVLVGRDERSLELGFAGVASKGHGEPGRLQDFKSSSQPGTPREFPPKGIYSRAVSLAVEDTAALWNKPPLPQWEGRGFDRRSGQGSPMLRGGQPARKPKRIHLVILTHGLHSNIGADMLYLKESIDASAKQAREDMIKRRQASKSSDQNASEPEGKHKGQEQSSEDADEEVIVRGFPGNVCRTERGIKYLGKRLAKYILTLTYPDQPYLPPSRSMSKTFSSKSPKNSNPSSQISTPLEKTPEQLAFQKNQNLPYTFSSISFIGHSLGGLVQIYAIAYIQKYSPQFFEGIKPVNFVALASPLLGLSNENPLYIKFALDFGLVGRTGQDLGITWKPPTLARSGWAAMIEGFSSGKNTEKLNNEDPRSKPLLRILPTGPAHQVLKKFRNRTVYSNVVNDGIVPLRTSCLLFLDWRGLDRVENARRENGLITTMAQFGWNELTGAPAKSSSPRPLPSGAFTSQSPRIGPARQSSGGTLRQQESDVPQPDSNTTQDDNKEQPTRVLRKTVSNEKATNVRKLGSLDSITEDLNQTQPSEQSGIFGDFLRFFRPSPSPRPEPRRTETPKISKKARNTFRRAQTLKQEDGSNARSSTSSNRSGRRLRPAATRGDSLQDDPNNGPPPKTSVFEAAGDVLNPPIPPDSWLIDPSRRDRTIFHDRVYHPEDIPSPPTKRQRLGHSVSSSDLSLKSASTDEKDYMPDSSGMKVEEKIARAYHHNLSWRKVLVRLEPDAHNNMIVRRMFANAYGWEVVKHLCDTHFSDTYATLTEDAAEPGVERAKASTEPVSKEGEEVYGQTGGEEYRGERTLSEQREAADSVPDLSIPSGASFKSSPSSTSAKRKVSLNESISWTDSMFEESASDAESDDIASGPFETFQRFWNGTKGQDGGAYAQAQQRKNIRRTSFKLKKPRRRTGKQTAESGGGDAQIDDHLTLSPAQSRQGLGISKQSQTAEPSLEADAVEPLLDEETRPATLNNIGDQDNAQSSDYFAGVTSPTAELGLKKPPDAKLSDMPGSPTLTRNQADSVVEQVARLSVAGGEGSGSSDGQRKQKK